MTKSTTTTTSSYILDLQDINKTKLMVVGGKGTNLGELFRIEGVKVPGAFCVTTEVYKEIFGNNPEYSSLLDRLGYVKADDREGIRKICTEIRKLIETMAIPKSIASEIARHIEVVGERSAYAVRSSATAEDLPTASFAGQQDTYLNIIGKEEILKHISKCWASLFTDRAVTYRIQNAFHHKKAYLSVVIQKMIFSEIAGIMFTADPVTSSRKVLSIDASFGLGEVLVSGKVNPDIYKVREGKIIDKRIATKILSVSALKNGGTKEQKVKPELQKQQALTDEQILQLEELGRRIEKHFGSPQDIEWCLADGEFYIVQSRPITTLYPIPETFDGKNHVFLSVGHQQMMTDVMKPLGMSFFKFTSNAAMGMLSAGGRLFVDITGMLSTSAGRHTMINVLGKSDPFIYDSLTTITEREGFIALLPEDNQTQTNSNSNTGTASVNFLALKEYDPTIVFQLIERFQNELTELKQIIQLKSGLALIDFIRDDMHQMAKSVSNPKSMDVIMTAMNASYWVNEKMQEWLGEKNAADILSQSAPNNITSEMGLALLDVADAIRPYSQVIEYLQHTDDDNFLEDMVRLDGGKESRDAIKTFLSRYGMRCVGEIDITRDRWSEKPFTILQVILNNIKNFETGAASKKFEEGLRRAQRKERELLSKLILLPDGEQKAEETKRMIELIRNYSGYREYPKYSVVNRYFVYKQSLLKEAVQLVKAGVIYDKEDIFYLSLEELREVIQTNKPDYNLIRKRKEEYKTFEKLKPPRVFTSDGEIIRGRYKLEDLPPDSMAGLAVSSGVVEGRARVILNLDEANLEPGDILITSFTDPSWTPLFVSIKALVTEVGGLMTHGAVIAREYGLPAVVGIENATKLIKDGQRIKVNGTDGYVEIL